MKDDHAGHYIAAVNPKAVVMCFKYMRMEHFLDHKDCNSSFYNHATLLGCEVTQTV